MDAGVAGIAGAAIGGVVGAGGAVVAAYLTGKLQGRSQFANWRRQVRRDASANFLARAMEGARILALCDAALNQGDIARARDELSRYEATESQMVVQGVVVAIEGPASLDRKAAEVKENLMLWGWYLGAAVATLSSRGDLAELTLDERARLQQIEGDFNEAGERFIQETRVIIEREEANRTV
ncbi:hypothetical protein ACWCV5_01580 [Streptomyces tubercidicus]